jgi:hypothetical protein
MSSIFSQKAREATSVFMEAREVDILELLKDSSILKGY